MSTILNKKAHFNYQLLDRFESGISLSGAETKAIKLGRADLSNAFVRIMDGEAFLINAQVPSLGQHDYNPSRLRKLLLHKDQIVSLDTKVKTQKLTLIPSKLYTKGRLVKLEIALAKGKTKIDKKESIKRADLDREIEQELRQNSKF